MEINIIGPGYNMTRAIVEIKIIAKEKQGRKTEEEQQLADLKKRRESTGNWEWEKGSRPGAS